MWQKNIFEGREGERELGHCGKSLTEGEGMIPSLPTEAAHLSAVRPRPSVCPSQNAHTIVLGHPLILLENF